MKIFLIFFFFFISVGLSSPMRGSLLHGNSPNDSQLGGFGGQNSVGGFGGQNSVGGFGGQSSVGGFGGGRAQVRNPNEVARFYNYGPITSGNNTIVS
jgi:hypothetical protein